jgi:hypothetical protein
MEAIETLTVQQVVEELGRDPGRRRHKLFKRLGVLVKLKLNCKWMNKNDGHVIVLKEIERHKDDLILLGNGFGILSAQLKASSSSIKTQLQFVIANLGGVRLATNAMKQRPTESSLQANSCGFLAELARNNLEVACSMAKEEQGAIPAIISAMTNYPAVTSLQSLACSALFWMSFHTVIIKRIIHWGGIPLIISSMRLHPAVQGLQYRGCLALGNLVQSASGRLLFLGLDGFEPLGDARDRDWEDSKKKGQVDKTFLAVIFQFVRSSPNQIREWAARGLV